MEYIAALLSHSIGSRNYPSSPAGRLQKRGEEKTPEGLLVLMRLLVSLLLSLLLQLLLLQLLPLRFFGFTAAVTLAAKLLSNKILLQE